MAIHTKRYRHDALLRYANMLGTQEIHHFSDQKQNCHAIVVVTSTQLGPAIGGCRLRHYPNSSLALKDCLRLSYGMMLKAAGCELPHGGAKSVILMPKEIKDRVGFFSAFGDFVHSLGGKYITAMDMGTSTSDMDTIAARTPYVIGATTHNSLQGDPSPYTAQGVFHGIRAAVKKQLQTDDLTGLRITVQGAGKVSQTLCQQLKQAGAVVAVCDSDSDKAESLAAALSITAITCDEVYTHPCDIYAPCAIGGTVNMQFLEKCSAKIIAGAANNQLAHRRYASILQDRGILYAPDFIINAGGLIYAACTYGIADPAAADKLIDKIYPRLLTIFDDAERHNITCVTAAERLSLANLQTPQIQLDTELA